MKNSVLIGYLLFFTSFIRPAQNMQETVTTAAAAENLFIIITDGLRWQEIFNGADSLLINNEKFTPDTATLKSMYWSASKDERRKQLMPFLWNVIAAKGQLLGNRELGNKMNVANIYSVSYPGYNEIFTGTTDIGISGNSKKLNKNINVLEWLNEQPGFDGRIAVFSSWDVFPYILNRNRNGLNINSGYEQMQNESNNEGLDVINKFQEKSIMNENATRYDILPFSMTKEFIVTNNPRVIVLALGETDDFAHQKRYDLYLQQTNQVDKMIGELWNLVQTTPCYKNNTNFLITTDHGRGNSTKHWSEHGYFISGSSQTWLAMMGPSIKPLGERTDNLQLYSKELAETIANLVGKNFKQNSEFANTNIKLR